MSEEELKVEVPLVEELEELDMRYHMLTTLDNPYNPKTEYDKWREYDLDHNYNTEAYIDRIADLSGVSDIDNEQLIAKLTNKAIYEILEHDILGIYKLV